MKFEWNPDKNELNKTKDTLKTELTVCHCYRGASEDIVRIISARKATKKEAMIYSSGGTEE